MRSFLIAATLLVGVAARAEPVKLGATTLTATACTLDGPPLAFHERYGAPHGMVRTPKGELVLLDDDNRLRRYRPKAGKGCAFAIDKTFGKDGVLDLGLGTGEHVYPRLDVDADGTIYVSDVPKQQPLRIRAGKAEAMCGDDTRVNASPRSKIIWRYRWATKATREHGDCSGSDSAYLKGGYAVGAAGIFVIDDRAVGFGDDDDKKNILVVFGADGKPAGQLDAPPEREWSAASRFARCGSGICGLAFGQLALWDDRGTLAGVADVQKVIGATGFIATYDLAPGDDEAYLLYRANDPSSNDAQPGGIVRIDGFPR
jgi:hypothetical protein